MIDFQLVFTIREIDPETQYDIALHEPLSCK
jgi:hypothetical protein